MKKLFTIISIAMLGFASAQDYYFNRLIQYEENLDQKTQVLYNTENSEYFLIINDDDNVSADLYDRKDNKIHHFKVNEPENTNGVIYNYTYVKSDKFLMTAGNSNLISEMETTRDDGYYTSANVKVYNKANNKKLKLDAELTMRYANENKFDIFNLCCMLGNNFRDLKLSDKKFVVVKAKITDESNRIHNYRLISDQVIQFTLRIPMTAD